MKVFVSNTTTNMSFLSFIALTGLLNEISVLFLRSKSSQITTLCLAAVRTSTIKLVLYIISIKSTLSFRIWIFFLSFVELLSFWMISKPCVVATAKYYYDWFELIIFISGASEAICLWAIAWTWSISTSPSVVFIFTPQDYRFSVFGIAPAVWF